MKLKTKSLFRLFSFLMAGFSLIPVSTILLVSFNSSSKSDLDNNDNEDTIDQELSKSFISKFNKEDGLLNQSDNSVSFISDVLNVGESQINKDFLLKNDSFKTSSINNDDKNNVLMSKLFLGLQERIENTSDKKNLDWTYFFYQDILYYLHKIYASNMNNFVFQCYSFDNKEINDISYFFKNNPFELKEDGNIKLDLTVKLTNDTKKDRLAIFYTNNNQKLTYKLLPKESIFLHILSTGNFSASVIDNKESNLLTWAVPVKFNFRIENNDLANYDYESFVFNEDENYANVKINNVSLAYDPYSANKILVGENKLFNNILLNNERTVNGKKTFTKLTDSLAYNFEQKYRLTLSALKIIGDIANWIDFDWNQRLDFFNFVLQDDRIAKDISILIGNLYTNDYVPIIYSLLRSSKSCWGSKLDAKDLLTIIFDNKKILNSLINDMLSPIVDIRDYEDILNFMLDVNSTEELRNKITIYVNAADQLIPSELKPLINKLIDDKGFYLFDDLLNNKAEVSQIIDIVFKLLKIEKPVGDEKEFTQKQKIIKFIFTWKDFLLDAIYISHDNGGSTFKTIISKMIEDISMLDPSTPNQSSSSNLLVDIFDLLNVNLKELLASNDNKDFNLLNEMLKIFLFDNKEIISDNKVTKEFLENVKKLVDQISYFIHSIGIAYYYDFNENKLIKAISTKIIYEKMDKFNNKSTHDSYMNKVIVDETDNGLIVKDLNYAYRIKVVDEYFGIPRDLIECILNFLPKHKTVSQILGEILYENYDDSFFAKGVPYDDVKEKLILKKFINDSINETMNWDLANKINAVMADVKILGIFSIPIRFDPNELINATKYLIYTLVWEGNNVSFYDFLREIIFGNRVYYYGSSYYSDRLFLSLNSFEITISYTGQDIQVLPTYTKEGEKTKLNYQLINALQTVEIVGKDLKFKNNVDSSAGWGYNFLHLSENLNKIFHNFLNSFLTYSYARPYLSHVILPLEITDNNSIFIDKQNFGIDIEPNLFVKERVVNSKRIENRFKSMQESLIDSMRNNAENAVDLSNEKELNRYENALKTSIQDAYYGGLKFENNMVIKIDAFTIPDIPVNFHGTIDGDRFGGLLKAAGFNDGSIFFINWSWLDIDIDMIGNINVLDYRLMLPYSIVDISDPTKPKHINSIRTNTKNLKPKNHQVGIWCWEFYIKF